jgi:Cysteine-rich CWC
VAEPKGTHDNACCPRCGTVFHCGAKEAACACTQVALDAATRAAIAQRYAGCLCNTCLARLQHEADAAGG